MKLEAAATVVQSIWLQAPIHGCTGACQLHEQLQLINRVNTRLIALRMSSNGRRV